MFILGKLFVFNNAKTVGICRCPENNITSGPYKSGIKADVLLVGMNFGCNNFRKLLKFKNYEGGITWKN